MPICSTISSIASLCVAALKVLRIPHLPAPQTSAEVVLPSTSTSSFDEFSLFPTLPLDIRRKIASSTPFYLLRYRYLH